MLISLTAPSNVQQQKYYLYSLNEFPRSKSEPHPPRPLNLSCTSSFFQHFQHNDKQQGYVLQSVQSADFGKRIATSCGTYLARACVHIVPSTTSSCYSTRKLWPMMIKPVNPILLSPSLKTGPVCRLNVSRVGVNTDTFILKRYVC